MEVARKVQEENCVLKQKVSILTKTEKGAGKEEILK